MRHALHTMKRQNDITKPFYGFDNLSADVQSIAAIEVGSVAFIWRTPEQMWWRSTLQVNFSLLAVQLRIPVHSHHPTPSQKAVRICSFTSNRLS